MSPRRALLVARKEGRHIVRDPRTLYLALGIPLIMLLLFGYALTMDVDHVNLVVVDRDMSAASRDLVERFTASGSFELVDGGRCAGDAACLFRRGAAQAVLVIEAGFGRHLARNEEAACQLLVDGTNANEASIAIGFSAATFETASLELITRALGRGGLGGGRDLAPPVQIKVRSWFNQALRSQWYMVPGLVAVILAMIATLLTALTVAREWEQGTMEQLLVTPVRRSEIVVGKLAPYLVIGVGQLVLIASAGVLLFDVPLRGSILLLFGVAVVFLTACLGLGLLVSVVTRNQRIAMMVAVLSSMLPALLLSGFLSPIASMPYLIQKLTYVFPARYFLVVTRGIFLKGSGFAALRWDIAAIAAFAALFTVVSVARFKTRID